MQTLSGAAWGWTLVLFRVLGVFVMAPLLTSMLVPARFKILLGAGMAAAIFPLVLRGALGASPASFAPTDLWGALWIVLGEAMVGFVIGAIAAIPLLLIDMAGVVAGTTMGLGLARVYNPENDVDADVLGQMLFYVALAFFIAVGGLESLLRSLAMSFERVPPGAVGAIGLGPSALDLLVGTLASGFDLALRVASPVVAIIFLIIVLLGVLGKTMPQINAMSVGFAIKAFAGAAMMTWGLYAAREPIREHVDEALRGVHAWVEGLPRASKGGA